MLGPERVRLHTYGTVEKGYAALDIEKVKLEMFQSSEHRESRIRR